MVPSIMHALHRCSLTSEQKRFTSLKTHCRQSKPTAIEDWHCSRRYRHTECLSRSLSIFLLWALSFSTKFGYCPSLMHLSIFSDFSSPLLFVALACISCIWTIPCWKQSNNRMCSMFQQFMRRPWMLRFLFSSSGAWEESSVFDAAACSVQLRGTLASSSETRVCTPPVHCSICLLTRT